MRLRAGLLPGLALTLVAGVAPRCALGQSSSTVVGLTGGWVVNEQIWTPTSDVERVGGFVGGAFARVQTPVSWLLVQVEGTYTQRGGDVLLEEGGRGAIRSDYLTVSVHPRFRLGLGPVRVHVATGPTLDQLVRSRLDSFLAPILEDGVSTVFAWTAEAGLGGTIGSRGVDAELALRVVEGLGDAYSGDFVGVRNRSYEAVVRLGVPLRR